MLANGVVVEVQQLRQMADGDRLVGFEDEPKDPVPGGITQGAGLLLDVGAHCRMKMTRQSSSPI